MLARVRLLRGSDEVHTAQSQAIIGTPCDVPVPRKTISMLVSHGTRCSSSWQERHKTRPSTNQATSWLPVRFTPAEAPKPGSGWVWWNLTSGRLNDATHAARPEIAFDPKPRSDAPKPVRLDPAARGSCRQHP